MRQVHIGQVLQSMVEKTKASRLLSQQLKSLQEKKQVTEIPVTNDSPLPMKVVLQSITKEGKTFGARNFALVMTRDKATLHASFAIFVDYPDRAPKFKIHIENAQRVDYSIPTHLQAMVKTAALQQRELLHHNDPDVLQLEHEINHEEVQRVKQIGESALVLSHQIVLLMKLFNMLVECNQHAPHVSLQTSDNHTVQVKFCEKTQFGRILEKPIKQVNGLFVQKSLVE